MAKFNKRLLFIDGFAGPGSYLDGEPGSPIIALTTLLEHDAFDTMSSTEFVFVFLEAEEDRHIHLSQSLEDYAASIGGWPPNVRVDHRCVSFADGAETMLASLESSSAKLAPALIFVDPFGVSGLPMSTISQLARFPKAEVIVNMMINTVKRFAGKDIIDDNFDELFGSSAYHQCTELTGEQRQRCLHDTYKAELQGQGLLKFVWSFSMFNYQNQRSYYLFHGCQHIRGLEMMKDAMWKVDGGGGSEFRDIHAGVNVLFDEEPRYDLLRQSLIEQFAGQTVSISAIEDWVTVHTPFKKNGHLKKPVLKPLEEEGLISVISYPKKNRHGKSYIAGTMIKFSEDDQ